MVNEVTSPHSVSVTLADEQLNRYLDRVLTEKTLDARLTESNQLDLAGTVQGALDGLDPVLLLPPAFEGQGQPVNRRGGGRGRNR